MLDLTDAYLQVRPGVLNYYRPELDSPTAGTWSITIPLAPFSAVDEYEPDTFRPGPGGPVLIETEIRADFIDLPGAGELTALDGLDLTFPINPVDGYIDASVYLLGTHNPVDVTRIQFGPAGADRISARLTAHLDLDGTGIRARDTELDALLYFRIIDQLPVGDWTPPTR